MRRMSRFGDLMNALRWCAQATEFMPGDGVDESMCTSGDVVDSEWCRGD